MLASFTCACSVLPKDSLSRSLFFLEGAWLGPLTV